MKFIRKQDPVKREKRRLGVIILARGGRLIYFILMFRWFLAMLACASLVADKPSNDYQIYFASADLDIVLDDLSFLLETPVQDQVTKPVGEFNFECRGSYSREELIKMVELLLLTHGVAIERSADGSVKAVSTEPLHAENYVGKPLDVRAPSLRESLNKTDQITYALKDAEIYTVCLYLQKLTSEPIIIGYVPGVRIYDSPEGGMTYQQAIERFDMLLVAEGLYLVERNGCYLVLPSTPPEFEEYDVDWRVRGPPIITPVKR